VDRSTNRALIPPIRVSGTHTLLDRRRLSCEAGRDLLFARARELLNQRNRRRGAPNRHFETPQGFHEGIYHLAARASDERYLFPSGEDRRSFLRRLTVIAERFELALICYVIMGTHYHALFESLTRGGVAEQANPKKWRRACQPRSLPLPASSVPCAPAFVRAFP